MRLAYGGTHGAEKGLTISDAVAKVCDGGPLSIVAPYIDPDRLAALISASTRIRVITDFVACFSVLDAARRTKMISLVCAHIGAFRHLPGVHAKVLLSSSRLLVSSANLTTRGLEERDELGVFFFEATQLAEARLWTDELWSRASVLDVASFRQWAATLPAWTSPSLPPLLMAPVAKRAGSNATSPSPMPSASAPKLEDVLRAFPSKDWIRQYLGIIRWAYEGLGVEPDDARLVVTIRRDKGVFLSINNRWVLQHTSTYDGIGLLLPASLAESLARRRRNTNMWQFDGRQSGENPPYLFRFAGFDVLSDTAMMDSCREAMRHELRYARQSANRKYHRYDLQEIIQDEQKLEATMQSLRLR